MVMSPRKDGQTGKGTEETKRRRDAAPTTETTEPAPLCVVGSEVPRRVTGTGSKALGDVWSTFVGAAETNRHAIGEVASVVAAASHQQVVFSLNFLKTIHTFPPHLETQARIRA